MGNVKNYKNVPLNDRETAMNRDSIRTYASATAVLTGGASGIGRAMAQELAARGCEVVVADRQDELAEEVAAGIRASGGKARAEKLDVCDFDAVDRLVKDTIDRTGRLDYMFNNAGILMQGNACHHCIDDWNYIVDVNLRGVINGVQAAYTVMLDQGFGHIVNTASMAGVAPGPGMVSYCATKHAVFGLSMSLRGEAASKGVRVSVFCPGFIDTPILDGGGKFGKMLVDISPRQKQMIDEMIKKFRPIPPEKFAVKALDQLARNKAIIIVPAKYKLIWWIHRLFPSGAVSLAGKHFQEMQMKLEEETNA
jgi:NAD(P)-dependent dehydrogenase (short-subunit alcohol dehydrogenase family)